MIQRLLFLFLGTLTGFAGSAQVAPAASSPAGAVVKPFPTPEEFINAVFHTVVDSSYTQYYLITGADTCRFVKYDYDEWTKYYLKESVPMPILNELSEKAYLSRYPYFWKQDRLPKAVCISNQKADSIFSLANPALNASHKGRDKRTSRKIMQQWQRLPPQEKTVFSFSLPQFTDDGQYAVVDLNVICGAGCGSGLTCLFRHTSAGWRLIGQHTNWSS
ncbi:MAG TPA: hypothetical protein VNS58_03655 [Puia sp.]|nr:hypothetical protein [Puia sp.]